MIRAVSCFCLATVGLLLVIDLHGEELPSFEALPAEPVTPLGIPAERPVDLLDDFSSPLPQSRPKKLADKVETAKQAVTIQVELPVDNDRRRKAAALQAKYLRLFSGPELDEFIQRLEKDIVDRELDLATRTDEFSKKLDEIRAQLEGLRDDATSIGVRRQLELMIQAAEDARNAPGTPSEPTLAQPRDVFAPSPVPDFLPSF